MHLRCKMVRQAVIGTRRCWATKMWLSVYTSHQWWSMLWKSPPLTTASLLSINCRVMYQNTANDNFSSKRTCRPYLRPLGVMSGCLMRCVRVQTVRAPQTPQTTWDGYWTAVWPLIGRRRRGGQGEAYVRGCVCNTTEVWKASTCSESQREGSQVWECWLGCQIFQF